MITHLIEIFQAVTIGAVTMYFLSGMNSWYWAATVAGGCFVIGALALQQHMPGTAGFNGAMSVIYAWFAWHDWKKRPPRNRKKVLKALGNKALARLETLKKNMPRVPRLKPVPA